MNNKTKWIIISINLLGILLVFFLSFVISAIHEVHSFSMYREFESRGFINNERVNKWRKEAPQDKDYKIEERMKQIGAVKHYLGILSFIISFIFSVNILIVLISCKKEKITDNKKGAPLQNFTTVKSEQMI